MEIKKEIEKIVFSFGEKLVETNKEIIKKIKEKNEKIKEDTKKEEKVKEEKNLRNDFILNKGYFDYEDLLKEQKENCLKAFQNYKDKTFIFKGKIENIKSDSLILKLFNDKKIKIFFSKENLNKILELKNFNTYLIKCIPISKNEAFEEEITFNFIDTINEDLFFEEFMYEFEEYRNLKF